MILTYAIGILGIHRDVSLKTSQFVLMKPRIDFLSLYFSIKSKYFPMFSRFSTYCYHCFICLKLTVHHCIIRFHHVRRLLSSLPCLSVYPPFSDMACWKKKIGTYSLIPRPGLRIPMSVGTTVLVYMFFIESDSFSIWNLIKWLKVLDRKTFARIE